MDGRFYRLYCLPIEQCISNKIENFYAATQRAPWLADHVKQTIPLDWCAETNYAKQRKIYISGDGIPRSQKCPSKKLIVITKEWWTPELGQEENLENHTRGSTEKGREKRQKVTITCGKKVNRYIGDTRVGMEIDM